MTFKFPSMSVRYLRRTLPSWSWEALRNGYGGWEYIGRSNGKRVRVYAVSVLTGPTDDDYTTQWRVEESRNQPGRVFVSWAVSNAKSTL